MSHSKFSPTFTIADDAVIAILGPDDETYTCGETAHQLEAEGLAWWCRKCTTIDLNTPAEGVTATMHAASGMWERVVERATELDTLGV